MKLMTKELEKKFKKFPLYSQEEKGKNAVVVVKYFNPYGCGTWLITEGEKQVNGDWLLFGYCNITEWEWGYVLLSELQKIKIFGTLGIERELYDSGKLVKDLIK